MSLRARLGEGVELTLGKRRADQIRSGERRARQVLAARIAPRPPTAQAGSSGASGTRAAPRPGPMAARPLGEPNDRQAEWIPSDPFVAHPEPTMTRHDLLRELHVVLSPRTYLEIGVNEGSSLSLSRTRSIGVDPEFVVRRPLRCDLDLVKAKSDEFFGRAGALDHFDGLPVDLAFIDGMHLSEFALRDFINVERYLAPTGVAVFDDVLPRNGLEAARVRQTGPWAGDVYKAVETIARRRLDLEVVLINTWPTGTAVILGADPTSTVLSDAYASEVSYLEQSDPQRPPDEYLSRSAAVDPAALLASEAWPLLVAGRASGDSALVEQAKAILASLPRLGMHV